MARAFKNNPPTGKRQAVMRVKLVAAAFLMMGSTALAQVDIATDTELRVAYCLGVTEQNQANSTGPNSISQGLPANDPLVAMDREMEKIEREIAQQSADRRARLSGYLRARGMFTGERSITAMQGITAARRHGATDMQQALATISACTSKCMKPSHNQPYSQECIDTCLSENPSHRAVLRCRDNDPLPY
jgi:hypothetical protein